MLTARESADDLLRFLLVTQRDYPPAATEDDPLPHVLRAQNQALAECATFGPIFHFTGNRSAVIEATVTLAANAWTARATTVTLPAGASWILGCSIKFDAEPWNEIIAWNNGTKVATLLNPFLASGTGSCAVYCDSVTADSDVLQVLGPVAIADGGTLVPRQNLNGIRANQNVNWSDNDYGFRGTNPTSRSIAIEPAPRCYWVDKQWRTSGAAPKRIRLAPMPTQAAILNYRARIQPPILTVDDLYDDGDPTADPGTEIPFEDAIARTVYQPIVRQIFTGSPMFKSAEAKKQIAEDYAKAISIAKQMRPQGPSGHSSEPGY